MLRTTISITLAACLLLAVCSRSEGQSSAPVPPPDVFTADIQAGIEKHVEEQVRAGGGFFNLPFNDRQLKLKLVRVHTEYLANLGPRYHFACVDLADVGGDVFDVDFFLKGDPGAMSVTETTVHKINGQPYYAWDQGPDGTWKRIPVTDAKEYHLGVLHDSDEFDFTYQATLPPIPAAARAWVPIAATDRFQTVDVLSISAPGRQTKLTDRDYGNSILFLELGAADGGKTVEVRYHVKRHEKAAYDAQPGEAERFLKPEHLVPADARFTKEDAEILTGKKEDLVRARAIYDHVIDTMKYQKAGKGWGNGDAVFACDSRFGNCTDFHALFIALARATGIPARFAIGASIPADRPNGGIDGYHCWAEFLAEGKWWPVDISEGDKYTSLSTYYFGHHPANRFELSRGRDLVVDPAPASGPLNFLAYPAVEIDGKLVKGKIVFSFERKGGGK